MAWKKDLSDQGISKEWGNYYWNQNGNHHANYLESLADNCLAQYWTNEGRTIQPVQSMGLAGL
jgi:hypothetical protein